MKILVKNIHTLVTMDNENRQLHNIDLLINNNKIEKIDQNINEQADRIIMATNQVVYPGFINPHHHFYQSLTRNIPSIQSVKLFDWLTMLYEVWRGINEEVVRISTQIAVGELLLSGCTTAADHYYVYHKSQSNELLDLEIETAQQMGIRFYPNRGSMSLGKSQGGLPPDDVIQTEDEIIKDCERVINKFHNPDPFSMCRVILAPCSPFSVTPELLKETAKFARTKKVMFHTHLAETKDETEFCLKKFGVRPLEYMAQNDWLGHDVYFAHGVHFNDDEIKLLGKTQTGIAHCPASNMRLGSGISRVPALLKANVPVSLAVDGSASNDSSNYVREMQIALLIHRIGTGVDSITPNDILKIATTEGARILNTPEIGSIEVGKAADLAIFNLEKLEYAGTMSDPASAIIMCGGGARANYTIVNGKILVDQGKLLGVDEKALFAKANEVTKGLSQTLKK